jgi:hypothetical protein
VQSLLKRVAGEQEEFIQKLILRGDIGKAISEVSRGNGKVSCISFVCCEGRNSPGLQGYRRVGTGAGAGC